jgi:hypothetical protein
MRGVLIGVVAAGNVARYRIIEHMSPVSQGASDEKKMSIKTIITDPQLAVETGGVRGGGRRGGGRGSGRGCVAGERRSGGSRGEREKGRLAKGILQ